MIFVIVGPTGIGKTALSLEVARYLDTEIISGDSSTVYKGLNIGTAKVALEDRQNIKHHMIDILNPHDLFSVAIYQKMVREKIAEICKKNKHPLIVGGTGFYIRSVLHDYHFHGDEDKDDYVNRLKDVSNEVLYERLKLLDQAAINNLHPNNRKRVIQALYRAEKGKKMSDEKAGGNPIYDYTIIGLRSDRKILYQKLDERVDKMVHQGLLEEVKSLYDANIHHQSIQAIGYKELYEYFDGTVSLEQAIINIKQNTRHYVKRQYTYFNNQFRVQWFDVSFDDFDKTINEVLDFIETILQNV